MWQVERLLNETKDLPQILLMENVTQVHSKKNIADFQKWIKFLESKGYRNYYQDLNAKDYGMPQSRNRCFMVSVLGNFEYKFPDPKTLNANMNCYLDNDIDDKYYLYSDKAKSLIDKMVNQGDIFSLLNKSSDKIQIFGTMDSKFESTNRVHYTNGVCPTISTCQGGNQETKIVEFVFLSRNLAGKTKKPIAIKPTDVFYTLCARDYRGFHNRDFNTIIRIENENTLNENSKRFVYDINGKKYLIRIRRLTPKEHWRLMGFSNEDFKKAKSVNSNTQLYKQAGNAIVKQVLMEMFKQML